MEVTLSGGIEEILAYHDDTDIIRVFPGTTIQDKAAFGRLCFFNDLASLIDVLAWTVAGPG